MTNKEVLRSLWVNIKNYDAWDYLSFKITHREADALVSLLEKEIANETGHIEKDGD